MLPRRLFPVLMLLGAVACVSAPPRSPRGRTELWEDQRCFAHILPEWRNVEAFALEGVVFTEGSTPTEFPIPVATVFVRPWPTGSVTRSQVNANGYFSVPGLRSGTYEIAVCAEGWNPWRGTVRLSRRAPRAVLPFPLEIGM